MRTYDMDSEEPSIWKASYEGSDQELAQMLGAGADPNERARMPGSEGRPDSVARPLDRAACADRAGAVTLLIAAGAEVDAPDEDGLTPLMVAAWFGCLRAARALLEGGADPNARDPEGASALHYATGEGLMSEAIDMLERGARASLAFEDGKGRLPLDLAIREGSLALVDSMAARMDELALRAAVARWERWMGGQDLEGMERMDLFREKRSKRQEAALLRARAALRPLDEAVEIEAAAAPAAPAPGARGSWL